MHGLNGGKCAGFDLEEFRLARIALADQEVQRIEQRARAGGGIRDQADVGFQADHFGGIDVEAHRLQVVRTPLPAKMLQLQPAADPDEQIGILPILVRGDRAHAVG